MNSIDYVGVVFDLDMTLVDSRCVAHFRAMYQWEKALKHIDKIVLYPKVGDLFKRLKTSKIPFAIATSSPKTYANAIVKELKIPTNIIVTYHDTLLHKPHPEPLLNAATLLNIKPSEIVAIGDRFIDIEAANSAEMISVAALWGCTSIKKVKSVEPDYCCDDVVSLIRLLGLE